LEPAELCAHLWVVLGLSHHGAHQPDRVAELVETDQRPKRRAVEGAHCVSNQPGADRNAIVKPIDVADDRSTDIEPYHGTDRGTDRFGAHHGANDAADQLVAVSIASQLGAVIEAV